MTKGMIGAIRGLGEKSRYLRFVYEWTTKSLEAIGKTDKGDKEQRDEKETKDHGKDETHHGEDAQYRYNCLHKIQNGKCLSLRETINAQDMVHVQRVRLKDGCPQHQTPRNGEPGIDHRYREN